MRRNLVQGANVILFQDTSVLLLQRKDKSWEFPGGTKEDNDISLKACAVREVREETGLVLALDSLKHVLCIDLPSDMYNGKLRPRFTDHYYAGLLGSIVNNLYVSSAHIAFDFTPKEEALDILPEPHKLALYLAASNV